MASRKLSDAHVKLQQAFMFAVEKWRISHPDITPFITCSYRSPEEQHCLFIQPHDGIDNDKDGRTDEPDEKVTNADRMQSAHNYDPSRAIDFAFKLKDGSLSWNKLLFKEFAELMLKYDNGLVWGGSWESIKDYPHVELKNWKNA